MKHFIYGLSLILVLCGDAFASQGIEPAADIVAEAQQKPRVSVQPSVAQARADMANKLSIGLLVMSGLVDAFAVYMMAKSKSKYNILMGCHAIFAAGAILTAGLVGKYPPTVNPEQPNKRQKQVGYRFLSSAAIGIVAFGQIALPSAAGAMPWADCATWGWILFLGLQAYARLWA